MEAVKVKENDFTAHYNLGNSFYKRKMYDEAKAEYEKAELYATSLPDKAAALYNLGNSNFEKDDTKKAAELYKQALKQDPYNEAIRKNYEIAMLKEKEKENQKKQKGKSGGGGGDGQEKDQNKGQEKGNTPQEQAGSGQKNKGEGEGDDPNKNKGDDEGKMPKDLENSILNRVENKERETAKRILNKNSYSTPQSNEKDW
ncbi:tetratricopeptide repeat protein [Kaistella jeonii]|uniref:tetratricopeptide repeat protein n=1 Tax=Kaistella jeonii TaxID=266749 RepID=UPI002938DE17|nr:tetratricopeptide repeat protein [Kaistella jeonii]